MWEQNFASTQLLQIPKNQLIELEELLDQLCKVLIVFGFNSAKHDVNFIKSHLLPIVVKKRVNEPTVIKEGNPFTSFIFNDIQLSEKMDLPSEMTSWFIFEGMQNFRNKGILPP